MDQPDNSILVLSSPSFESLKKYNQNSVEYWGARDLQPCLGYCDQESDRSCRQSGNDPKHHFVGAEKPIPGGKGSPLTPWLFLNDNTTHNQQTFKQKEGIIWQ